MLCLRCPAAAAVAAAATTTAAAAAVNVFCFCCCMHSVLQRHPQGVVCLKFKQPEEAETVIEV